MEILSLFCICACMEIAFAGKYNSSGVKHHHVYLAIISCSSSGIPTNMGQDHVGLTVPSAQEAADFLINLFDCEFDWEVKRGPAPTAGERGWSDLFGVHPESYMPHVSAGVWSKGEEHDIQIKKSVGTHVEVRGSPPCAIYRAI